jgi:hypothetical protein
MQGLKGTGLKGRGLNVAHPKNRKQIVKIIKCIRIVIRNKNY